MFGQHTVDIVAQCHVAALFDVEWPLAAALETALAQFAEEPTKHRQTGSARRLQFAPLTQYPVTQTPFQTKPRRRLEHSPQRAGCPPPQSLGRTGAKRV